MFSPNIRSIFFFIIIFFFFFIEQSYILPQKLRHERHTDVHTCEISTSTRTILRRNDLRIDTAVWKNWILVSVSSLRTDNTYTLLVFTLVCTGLARTTWRSKHKRKKKEYAALFLHLCLYCLCLELCHKRLPTTGTLPVSTILTFPKQW